MIIRWKGGGLIRPMGWSLGLLGLIACGTGCQGGGEGEAPAAQVIPLDAKAQLMRLSLDLRGVPPTEAEFEAIAQSPGLYDDYVDAYLEDPRFIDRMAEVFNHAYLTRVERLYYGVDGTALEGVDTQALADDIGEESLKLLGHILRYDLPYSEIVTAPFSFATPHLAEYWQMDYPAGETGWQQVTYRDGRPHAGILSMSSFWARYPSMGGNANRHRANAISRVFLCDDFLDRPIVVNRTVVDQLAEDPEEAIRTNDSCQSCHSSLDPLSGALFGFFKTEEIDGLEMGRLYQPENERLWQDYSGRAPGYFGRPVANLAELGQEIAADPRFSQCAVKTLFKGLTQRPISDADWGEFNHYLEAFEANDLSVRAAVRSIVTHPHYKAAHVVGDDALAERLATVRTLSPSQLAHRMEAITGYRWEFDGRDGLRSQVNGLNVLAGGIDGISVVKASHMPAVGLAFVHERLAQSAAYHVVQHDFDPDRSGDAYLLAYVGPDYNPQGHGDAFNLQIQQLYHRALGVTLADDAQELQDLKDLWTAIHSVNGSSQEAWTGVVSAVLRDPQFLFY